MVHDSYVTHAVTGVACLLDQLPTVGSPDWLDWHLTSSHDYNCPLSVFYNPEWKSKDLQLAQDVQDPGLPFVDWGTRLS